MAKPKLTDNVKNLVINGKRAHMTVGELQDKCTEAISVIDECLWRTALLTQLLHDKYNIEEHAKHRDVSKSRWAFTRDESTITDIGVLHIAEADQFAGTLMSVHCGWHNRWGPSITLSLRDMSPALYSNHPEWNLAGNSTIDGYDIFNAGRNQFNDTMVARSRLELVMKAALAGKGEFAQAGCINIRVNAGIVHADRVTISTKVVCDVCGRTARETKMAEHQKMNVCTREKPYREARELGYKETSSQKLREAILRGNVPSVVVPVKWRYYVPQWVIKATAAYENGGFGMTLAEYLAVMTSTDEG
jgi:hypothetical protein